MKVIYLSKDLHLQRHWNKWYVWEKVNGCWIKHRLRDYGL